MINIIKTPNRGCSSFRRWYATAPLCSALVVASSLLPIAPVHADYSATVDASTKHQIVEGWGTSLAWWGKVIGGFPDASRNDYITKFFDPVNGLGLNVVRYNIGGGENPADHYLSFRGAIPGFEPSSGTYDWTADANQRWVLQQAIAKGANVLEAFSNSPPYWMTNSLSVTGASGGGTNLNATYNSAFADYLTEVVKHYHDTWGITFNTLEPFNEPDAGWWNLGGPQEGCHVDPGTQNTVAKLVGASLATKSLATKLSANDDNGINDTVNRIGSHYDATALGYISQINTHAYNGDQRTQLAALASSLGKDLHMSEVGDSDGSGLSMSYEILADMRDMQATAWVYWQTVDSSAGWGFFKNAESSYTNTSYTINQKYYVMGNYSKYIRPGYQIVDINDTNSLAAYNAAAGTVVIVTTGGSTAQNVTYNLSNFGSGTWTAIPHRTGNGQNLAQLASFPVASNTFTYAIPANSVTTFVLTNSNVIANGTYRIMNRRSNKALDVFNAGTANGSNVDQWTYSNIPQEQWTVTSLGNGQYKIINVGNGKSLDVAGGSTADSANVDISDYTGAAQEKWTFTALGGGNYTITSVNSGKVLDVANLSTADGANVQQYTSNGGANQQWQFLAP